MQDRPQPHVLREYAFIADGYRGALIGPRGDIGFLCVPDWDSPAVFTSLLGGRGHYTITPASPHHVWGGSYAPSTLIWTSRWTTPEGVTTCREALAYPGDPHAAVLLRQVHAVDTEAVVDVSLDVRAEFGSQPMRDLRCQQGVWVGRSGHMWLRWTGAAAAQPDEHGVLRMRLRLPRGARHDLVLEIRAVEPAGFVSASTDLRSTERTWQDGAPRLSGVLAQRDAVHAVSVLRGMTHPTGGMVAAATTSLPERAEQGRNYDYRYAWIRDQCFAGQAAAAADNLPLLDAAVRFVTARLLEHGPRLAPAYTVSTSRPAPDERRLTLRPGDPGGVAVEGNRANDQFQLDAFGECLLLLAAAGRCQRLDADSERAMQVAADAVAARWHEPDSGIWELDNHRWTHSALTCVAGLRASVQIAPRPVAANWSGLADAILSDVGASHVHRSGRWQRARDDDRLDASLLLPMIRRALPLTDPRSRFTLAAVQRELMEDGYEGAFLLCSFALAYANHQAGDLLTGARLFERSRAACGPAGLFAEEYDVRQRQLRGNLPQAFVHALMLETAVALSSAPVPVTP
jgi:alpha,alpha-trehalase